MSLLLEEVIVAIEGHICGREPIKLAIKIRIIRRPAPPRLYVVEPRYLSNLATYSILLERN
jgi:hypothetical protein